MTQYDATLEGVHTAFPPEQQRKIRWANTSPVSERNSCALRKPKNTLTLTSCFRRQRGDVMKERRARSSLLQKLRFDLQPEMSAVQVKEAALSALRSGKYDAVIMNFANPDIVVTPACSRQP